jgi:2-methylcitrate dehydratase PrpD
MNCTEEQIVKYVTFLRYDDIPSEIILSTKKLIMDVFGAMFAGSGAQGVDETARLIKEWGGKPESTVFFHESKVPAPQAALVNATMARAVDLDAYHIPTGSHPLATAVPTALAAAESYGEVSGKEFIAAVVAGSEIAIRMRLVPDYCLGLSGWSSELHQNFGSAITAGKIMKLSASEMWNALGLAYAQAGSNFQGFRDGADAVKLQQGFSARTGLVSVMLAKRGITGARDFLEGKAGFYPVYYRGINYNIDRLMDGIGEKYEVLGLATKLYPTTGFLNGPIENVLDIIRKNQLSKEDIDKVVLLVGKRMYNNTCEPQALKYRPKTEVDAVFSMPYAVGTAIYRGDVFLDDFFPEAIKDHERLREIDKIEPVLDQDIEEEAKELNLPLSLHVVEVKTKNGKKFSQKMLYAKGSPQKPMTFEDCAEKFKRCAHFAVKKIPEDKLIQLIEMINTLEQEKDVRSLTNFLT